MSSATFRTPDGETLDLDISRRRPRARPAPNISKLLSKTGLVTYDPGFANTASCTSEITYIDGDAGILRYRGYPIDQLAEESTFLETSYLLIYGELPTRRPAAPSSPSASAGTRCCTRTSSGSSTASRATRTRCRCCPRRCRRCRRSTRTRSTRSTRRTSSCRPSGCWPSCRRSPPTRTRSRSASRSSTRTTRSAWSRTSCG